MISILIPTIKELGELSSQIQSIKDSLSDYEVNKDYEIVTSCCKQSSSLNRNACLEKSKGEYVIFNDDDIRGYKKGWAHELILPLQNDDNIKIISARLMNVDGTPGTMISYRSYINECKEDLWINPHILLPAACIAFTRNTWLSVRENPDVPDNIPFDIAYPKAVAEDSDFIMAIQKTFPDMKTAVNKKVKICHLNSEVWRSPDFDWTKNHQRFKDKWHRDQF